MNSFDLYCLVFFSPNQVCWTEYDDDAYLVSIGLVRMEMQVAEEGSREPAAERNVDKKAQDAVVWPLVVTKPLSTSLAPPSLSKFLLLLSFQHFLFLFFDPFSIQCFSQ